MIFFPWTVDCSVGVAVLDNEHWQLMKLVNDLYDGMLSGTATDKVLDVIDGVGGYASMHLKHEEDAMAWADFPDAESHIHQHEIFRQTMHTFKARAIEAKGTLALIDVTRELSIYLKEWIHHHIQEEDKALGHFLNGKGVR